MTLQGIVREDFQEFIKLDSSVPQELKDSLRLKERVPAFLDRLSAELQAVELSGIHLDRIKIKSIVYDLSKTFVYLLKIKAEEMQLSDIAKRCAQQAIEGDDLIKKLDKEGNGDFTEELGCIIADKQVN